MQRLIDARLLTTDEGDGGGEPRVDLAHEILITAWPTLANWIEDRRARVPRSYEVWLDPQGRIDSTELAK